MWIRKVDFPQELIEAHRAGRLVLFVGAGTSHDTPSDLPDFRTLTADIAADAGVAASERELERPDVLLGRIEDAKVDVHKRVASLIGRPSSRPNKLHEAIVSLAAAGSPTRIVTTNYDLHLSTLVASWKLELDDYVGPALPMGDDFAGLVYLHGNLRQEARRLVVTDGDFGRAYLRDAWAARFLERMFAAYSVLFIGYSHSDVVMRYLGRALRSETTTRYVLTSDPTSADWGQLGLRPVGYQLTDGAHGDLADAVDGWAALASMGLLAHRQRLAELTSAPPSNMPEEASYMEAVLTDGEKVRLFGELARGQEWLSWAATQPEFRRLFDPRATPSACGVTLAYWFAQHFVMDETLTAQALAVVQEAGGRLGETVWSAIGHHLHMGPKPRPGWLGPWVVLLVEDAPHSARDWLEYALVASTWPEDKSAVLLLFDHLTEPLAEMRPSFSEKDAPRFDVQLRGSGHWVRDGWHALLNPNLLAAAPAVLSIVDRQLRRAHHLLVATGAANPGWDPVSFRRSAIESHPQDLGLEEPVDVLIDAARDSIEVLLDENDDLATAYLDAWARSDIPILRRLAVHGWVMRRDVDATRKVMWLRERGWLFDHQLRHEVFRIVEVALATASQEVANGLVADVLAAPSEVGNEELRAYLQFNALAWITRHSPNLQSAVDALDQLKEAHPDFAERPHPDLRWSFESGIVQPRPSMTASQLHERIVEDAASAVAELRRYEHVDSPFEHPRWEYELGLIVEVVGDHPEDGLAVLDAEREHEPDMVRSVIRGWTNASPEPEVAERILNRLGDLETATIADELSQLLSGTGRGEGKETEWHRFSAARSLAADAWATLGDRPPAEEFEDWLLRALNHPAGQLAQFWVTAVAADWRSAGEGWRGLPEETRTQLENLLLGGGERTAMAEVILASQLWFFFGADRTWCEAFVLPLLDWTDEERALRTWHGYLTWGRWNDELLKAGLLTQYLAAAHHMDQLRDELRRQLSAHLAGMALSSEIEPLEWMRTFTLTVGVADRVEWLSHVGWMLSRLPTEAVEHQWQRWMWRYWRDRLDSIPVELTLEEASAMAAWVIDLTDSLQGGVALAIEHPARLDEHTQILHELSDKRLDRLDRAPAALARLLAHLLKGTHPPFWGCYDLDKIVPRLHHGGDPSDMRTIVEEALRLGCGGATQWSSA